MDEFEKRVSDAIVEERDALEKLNAKVKEHDRKAKVLRKAAQDARDNGDDDLARTADNDAQLQEFDANFDRARADAERAKISGKYEALDIYRKLMEEKKKASKSE